MEISERSRVPAASGRHGPEPRPPAAAGSRRLAGIDGLRAAAALWVVFFHVHAFSQARFPDIPGLDLLLKSGSTGVSLFLVLSGFCLYLPFAGGKSDRFRTGTFLLRRCRRLMPAYYVSLLFALLLSLFAAEHLGFDRLGAADAVWQVVTHAAFVHTLFPDTYFGLNGAYWSLGLEWQLYLAMPLVVWGVRTVGLRNTVLATVACNVVFRLALSAAIDRNLIAQGSALALVLPNQLPGRCAEFVYGVLAAELYATGRIARWAHRLKPLLLVLLPASLLSTGTPLSHPLYGTVFAILLAVVLASDNVVSRGFSWRPLAALGTMSYSLYLVHEPIIQGAAHVLRAHARLTPQDNFLVLVAGTPAILLLSWLLFVTVERRALTNGAPAAAGRPEDTGARALARLLFRPLAPVFGALAYARLQLRRAPLVAGLFE